MPTVLVNSSRFKINDWIRFNNDGQGDWRDAIVRRQRVETTTLPAPFEVLCVEMLDGTNVEVLPSYCIFWNEVP